MQEWERDDKEKILCKMSRKMLRNKVLIVSNKVPTVKKMGSVMKILQLWDIKSQFEIGNYDWEIQLGYLFFFLLWHPNDGA